MQVRPAQEKRDGRPKIETVVGVHGVIVQLARDGGSAYRRVGGECTFRME